MNSDLIKEAISYQKQDNYFFKCALSYSGCTLGNINIVYHWFNNNTSTGIDKIKKDLNFPSTDSVFESSWWKDDFIKQTLYKSGFKSYFEKILNELNDKGDSNSNLLFLGVNKVCKTSRYPDFIDKKVYDEIDLRMMKILSALYVILYKSKLPGDKTSDDFYLRNFGISVSPEKSNTNSKKTNDKLVFWKEIPPKLREKFECENKEQIDHSYTYIKQEFEKFIKTRYFERDDIYGRYDHALNVLMSRFKNGSFNFDDFWKLLSTKYRNNNEVKTILLTDIKIKCPKTSSGNNLYVKSAFNLNSRNHDVELSNINSIDYQNINESIKYSLNLPSRQIVSIKTFNDPHTAACELNLPNGIITRGSLASFFYNKWRGTAPHNDEYLAWTYLFNYVKNNGPYAHLGCGSSATTSSSSTLPATIPGSTVPASTSSSPSSSSSSSTGSATPTVPSPKPPGTTPIPAPPVPSPKPGICVAKFYDLGFINYCGVIIEPKELKEVTENLINTIQNLQFVTLSKEARRADKFTKIIKNVDDVVDIGIGLAPLFLGRR